MTDGDAAAIAPTGVYSVELRVHGVSGTPPGVMLTSEHVRQVAGDDRSRFFRPCDASGDENQSDPTRILEGYHWGQFTAGSWRQGLWLVLIPFGFVNAAAFMLPDPRGHRRGASIAHTTASALIRLVGIGQTCTIALASSLIFVDLLTVQAQQTSWLRSVPDGLLPLGTAAAAALVVAGLFVMGLQPRYQPSVPPPPTSLAAGLMAARDTQRHSGTPGPGQPAPVRPGPGQPSPARPGAIGLCRPDFYGGRLHAPTLSRLHLGAGVGVVALVVALKGDQSGRAPAAASLAALGAALVVTAAAITTFLGDPERSTIASAGHERWHRVAEWLSWVVAGAAPPLLLAAVVLGPDPGAPQQPLDFEASASWLVYAMSAVMVGLLGANGVLAALTRRTVDDVPRAFRPYAAGMAPWATSSVGVFLGVGYSAAAVLATANALGVDPPSPLIFRIAHAWGVTVVLGAVLAAALLGRVLWRARRTAGEVHAAYAPLWCPDDPTHSRTLPHRRRKGGRWVEDGDPGASYRRVATACEAALLKNALPLVFVGAAALGLAMSLAASLETTPIGDLPVALGELSEVESPQSSSLFADLGTYALIGLAGLLLLLGRQAIRASETRRGVNIIWDVVSFWPHSAHPFVPPPYSQTAVPALAQRIRFHTGCLDVRPMEGQPADHVVLAPHSQGSLIGFASLLWLSEDEISRVGLVTHGSQLQVAFPRAFPAYVDYALVSALFARLRGRWVNLYRQTDPIAGPVLSWDRTPMAQGAPASRHVGAAARETDRVSARTGRRESGPDWRLLDPTPADNERMLVPLLRMCKHSDFPRSPDWQDALDAVRPGARAPAESVTPDATRR
jgi:hypothetical protein